MSILKHIARLIIGFISLMICSIAFMALVYYATEYWDYVVDGLWIILGLIISYVIGFGMLEDFSKGRKNK